MGHIEHYEFTDIRSGANGVSFTAPTEAELQTKLQVKGVVTGYSGPFIKVVRAFPPAPPASVLRDRAEREKYGYADGEVQW